MCPSEAEYLIENLHEALPAYPLLNNTSLDTAYCNDVCADMSFAQQIYGYGKKVIFCWVLAPRAMLKM